MDVSRFLERARLALRKRNADQAITLFRQVLLASPGHAEAREGLMAAYRRRAELKRGPSLLDKAAARSLYAAALGLRSSKRWGAVAKSCDTALERNPEDGGAVALLAEALENQGHKEEALACWVGYLESTPQDLAALKGAARLHYELRNVAQAIECLEQAHAIDRHDPEVERLRKDLAAEGTLASTRYETATSSREVIKDRDAMRRDQGQRRAGGGQASLDELIADFRAEPGSVDLRRRVVAALESAGRQAEAAALLEEAMASRPQDDGLADARGEALLAANEAELRAARERGERDEEQRLRSERTRLEIEEYGRRVGRRPGDGIARVKLARACYRGGQVDQAIEHFQAGLPDPRLKLDCQQGLGACFFRKQLYPLAARQWEAALEGAGGLASDRGKEICYHLGLVAERLGDPPGALARYLQVYEVDINYRDVARKIEELRPEG
jgi:tetratricopeptide (TPR) repeat protein